MTEVKDEFLLELQKCMQLATMFFEKRDEMNARLHLAEVRYSPLTQLVEENYRKVNNIVNRHGLPGKRIRELRDSDPDTPES